MRSPNEPTQENRAPLFRPPRAIFWSAFAVRVICIVIGHTYRIRPVDDHFDYGFEAGRIARSLVTGHGYGNPFNGESGPSAWLPPLYPLLMALAFKLFGVYTKSAAAFLMIADSLFSALIAPAVYEIAARCFDAYGIVRRVSTKAAPVALWAGWLWALYPAAIQYAIHWLWEMSLSSCLFAWALVLALRLRRMGEHDLSAEPQGQWGLWASFGLLWGLMALSNTTLLICMPAVTGWILWPSLFGAARRGLAKGVAGTALCGLMITLCLTPWVERNERVMHAFVPARSNFGIELWNATKWYHDAMPWGSAVPLSATDPDFKLFAQMGEVRYAKMRQAQAMGKLKARPDLYAKFTAYRVQYFWFIWPHGADHLTVSEFLRLLNYGVLSVTGLLGLGLALRRKVPGAWMMFWVFLLLPVPYYMVTVQARFRHPMEPLICVLTVYLFRATEQKPVQA